jgi:hypothetical protein
VFTISPLQSYLVRGEDSQFECHMGRGRPFPRSLARLVRGGVKSRPPWLAAIEAVPPHFTPAERFVPPRLVFPEDRLREEFLQKNPDARRLPINLKARSRMEAHIADRFVAIQMRAIRERGLDKEGAYEYAQTAISEVAQKSSQLAADIESNTLSPSEGDETARLYSASLKESLADQELHEKLLNEQRSAVISED